MKNYIMTGIIGLGLLIILIGMNIMNQIEREQLVQDISKVVVESLKDENNKQQLTYPLDVPSTVAVEKATDTFLYTKIFDLVWKKFFHYITFFESLDGFRTTFVGAGTATVDYTQLTMTTANANNDSVTLEKYPTWQGLITFSQPSNIRTTIDFTSDNSTMYIVVGSLSSEFYGFKIAGGNLYGVSSGNGTGSEVTVLLTAVSGTIIKTLEARYTPSQDIKFLVDNIELGKLYTGLPSSVVAANPNFYTIKVLTNTTATKTLKISYFEYLQRRNILQ